MKFYPAELPLPLQSGYTSQHRPNMIRTQMADGYTRQRLINQGAPDTVQAQLIIDESQYRDMLTWYKADIRSGQDWFVMPLLRESAGDSATEYRCVRMQGGEFSAAVVSTNPHRVLRCGGIDESAPGDDLPHIAHSGREQYNRRRRQLGRPLLTRRQRRR